MNQHQSTTMRTQLITTFQLYLNYQECVGEWCRHKLARSVAETMKSLLPARAGPSLPLTPQRTLPRQAKLQLRGQGHLQQLPNQARAAWVHPLQQRRSGLRQESRTTPSYLLQQHPVGLPSVTSFPCPNSPSVSPNPFPPLYKPLRTPSQPPPSPHKPPPPPLASSTAASIVC